MNEERLRIGFVGLGKLGLPVATAVAHCGLEVRGYDVDARRMSKDPQPYQEAGPDGTGDFNEWLASARSLSFGPLEDVVQWADILFLAVQTPHMPEYEGVTRLPNTRADFSYSWLVEAVRSVARVQRTRPLALAVISTCLPGTMAEYVRPLLPQHLRLCYTPQFIAMGTTMRDFLQPEFCLLGVDDPWAADQLHYFYRAIGIPAMGVAAMSVESAELTKVAYNTFISFKVGFANLLQEVCHKIPGADVDEVTDALKRAHRRLISTAYLTAGMGDGGGCHPRDNIAMSWLARKLGLGYDLFDGVMRARESHADWIAMVAYEQWCQLPHPVGSPRPPVVVCGYAFKPGTNITVGSPARLVAELLEEYPLGPEVVLWDPHVDREPMPSGLKTVYILGCRHPEFAQLVVPEGSVVVDPFRYWVAEVPGVKHVPLGVGR